MVELFETLFAILAIGSTLALVFMVLVVIVDDSTLNEKLKTIGSLFLGEALIVTLLMIGWLILTGNVNT